MNKRDPIRHNHLCYRTQFLHVDFNDYSIQFISVDKVITTVRLSTRFCGVRNLDGESFEFTIASVTMKTRGIFVEKQSVFRLDSNTTILSVSYRKP